MSFRACGAFLALALGVGLATSASAQRKPTVAIMPTQYFSADSESAENVTRGLAEQFERAGYTVIPAEQAQSSFQSMGLNASQHYPDRVALKFGRSVNADLVAYPRLLALGIPVSAQGGDAGVIQPEAVVHLRVMNAHTGENIYFRQVGHVFTSDAASASAGNIADFHLPPPVASASAQAVTGMYFERVAGSRQEIRTR